VGTTVILKVSTLKMKQASCQQDIFLFHFDFEELCEK